MRKDFTIHWAKEAFSDNLEPDWVIDGLIWKPGTIMWYGDSGSKKTYAQLHQGVCVATGQDWLEFPTQQQTVLVIDEENGEFTMRRRIREILQGMGYDAKSVKELPFAWVCAAHWSYANLKDIETLKETVLKVKAGFVITDSMVDVMRGGDENSSKDTHAVMQHVRDVSQDTGCVMSVIHHTNRSGTFRGSSNIKGEVDVMIEVTSAAKSPNIDFQSEKNRHGMPFTFSGVAQFSDTPMQFTLTSSSDKTKQMNAVDLYMIRKLNKEPLTLEELMKGAPPSVDIGKLRRSALKLTTLKKVKRANVGNPAAYRLV